MTDAFLIGDHMDIANQLLYVTARIESFLPGGQVSVGTGFIFTFAFGQNTKVPALVTNKHVIGDANRIRINFCFEAPDNQNGRHLTTWTLDGIQNHLIKHPDKAVDICLLLINPLLEAEVRAHSGIRYVSIGEESVATRDDLKQMLAIEDVMMIGYPDGLYDAANGSPLVRKGITATPLFLDFNGESNFVVDMACYNGSSGSPVFILTQGAYATKDGGISLGNRFSLLGVQFAAFLHSNTGTFKQVPAPTAVGLVPSVDTPNNLGIVVKAYRILELKPLIQTILDGERGELGE